MFACSLLLFSSADASPWLWKFWVCCVSFQSQQCHIRRKNNPLMSPLTPVYFPCLFRKRIALPFDAKASHQDIMFCYFSATNPWSFPVIAFKDSIPFQGQYSTLLMKYFTYICSDLINTPELEVHQCYWKYLFELSFKQLYPSLIQMLQREMIRNHSKEICIAVIIKVSK